MSMRSIVTLEAKADELGLPFRQFHRVYAFKADFLPPNRLGWYARTRGTTAIIYLGELLDDAMLTLENWSKDHGTRRQAKEA